ncbi:hypothetical protein A5893_15130 [Pedobacter psychrophilus]|uniref:IPT/TIG domain-containing protein n=2 Tax=Pedobacter psychrophilus TaxID=1826909 RepID=A0A179DB38_9SPHI|nr:hypothetical protein A5893_15130 [Pedobacter psychrophilus]
MFSLISCSKNNDPVPDPLIPPISGAVSISGISPDYGKSGTEIIVTGTNFSIKASENIVTLGGKAATVTAATATQLKIIAPADASHGNIEVKVGANIATSVIFNYEPIISSISATSGKVGDAIVITGQHFGTIIGDFEVKFNGTAAEITAATATTLSVKIPTGATSGLISVARKTKSPVNGPNFSVSAGSGGTSNGFTIINNSVTITNLLKSDGGDGRVLCMTLDESRNIAYACTVDQVVKIDLSTNAVSTIIKNSAYLNIPNGLPSAMDVDANGKVYVMAQFVGAVPPTGGNVFIIDPIAKTAKLLGNRYIGVSLVGSFGQNAPFQVMGNGEIIAIDQSFREVCKFSADLSVRTVIYTLPLVLETFVQLIKVNQNTARIVLTGISNKYYYDYSTSLGSKTNFDEPTGFKMISQTIGGNIKYGVAGEIIVDNNNKLSVQQRTTYTVGQLNNAQTSFDKKGSFIIESLFETSNVKFYNFVGLNGKNYFYADKNGNMYVHILGSAATETGIFKISLN